MTTIDDLPDELLLEVFTYLSVFDLALSVVKVCIRWSVLAQDSGLWNRIHFTVDKNMYQAAVIRLLPHLTQLRYVTMQWRTDLALIVPKMCIHCKQLTSVSFVCCGFVQDDCVRQLHDTLPELTTFSLGRSWAVPRRCLEDVVLLKNVTVLDLTDCLLTPELFRAISTSCDKVISLDIDFVRHLSEEDLVFFITPRIKTLQSLRVFGEKLTDSIFEHIKLCLNLKLLHISSCLNFTDKVLQTFTPMKCLKSLTLRRASLFSPGAQMAFYLHSDVVKRLTRLYFSAKRIALEEDIKVWSKINPSVGDSLINQFCTIILTLKGVTVNQSEG